LTGGSVDVFSPRPGGGARATYPPPLPLPPPPYSVASLGHTRAICPKWPQFYKTKSKTNTSRVIIIIIINPTERFFFFAREMAARTRRGEDMKQRT
jgi:hypothetical protein